MHLTYNIPNKVASVIALTILSLICIKSAAQENESTSEKIAELWLSSEPFESDSLKMQEALDAFLSATNLSKTRKEYYRKSYMKIIRKSLGPEAYKRFLAEQYKKHYKEPEIEELYKFYKTPLGKKVITATQAIDKQMAQYAEDTIKTGFEKKAKELLEKITQEAAQANQPKQH